MLRLCSQILTELMRTYSASDAGEADPKLVERLVVLVISDSSQFVFDHLLSLPPLLAIKTHNIYKVWCVCGGMVCVCGCGGEGCVRWTDPCDDVICVVALSVSGCLPLVSRESQ